MIDYVTLGVETTALFARVAALLLYTRLVVRTLLTHNTLWTTVGRSANVVSTA